MTPLYDIEALDFAVPGRKLLQDMALQLPSGKVIGLIGHNGSGKSTLLNLLARQTTPDRGTIRFHGTALPDWPARKLARHLAYLPQHLPPAEGMLVRELAALGRYPWHGPLGRPGPEDHAAIDNALAACGLETIATRRVDTLSGGEAQRAWLAMLIAQEAHCLLLDEPISALDITHQVEVLSLVRHLSHDRDRSVIVVLHDLNMAARFCDHVVALRAGQVEFQGTPADLMTAPRLRSIYGADMEVLARADGTPVALPN
ncbi:ABC transporter ATP-binding protein [Allosediminivita pacifica]|uniref:Iron complex transport system ATP-binding protein n=1 Tax=Allosediminivita pacifica TaxID=1267769 RepID=A0A2T6AJH6_9RHOB|nr:ATP-binding cassette domain-containing protein [Allosediminivita pacifica]PTX43978.1 iron complex transport system ATP-binding protein [Allosediminivita pacifica]GGB21207.1 iron-hydroxamate transporter ATP-binding protein [Allosediminivita pacifica]